MRLTPKYIKAKKEAIYEGVEDVYKGAVRSLTRAWEDGDISDAAYASNLTAIKQSLAHDKRRFARMINK